MIPTVEPKNVYLCLPFRGDDVSLLTRRRLGAAITRAFPAAKLVFIEDTQCIPIPRMKDALTLTANSGVIYEFNCVCGCRYVGRTSRHLGVRISEHIPKWLLTSGNSVSRSAITTHLQTSRHIVDPQKAFRILYRPRHKCDLNYAETVAICRTNLNLCVQK